MGLPLSVPSAGGTYFLRSQAEADNFDRTLVANGLTEDDAKAVFADLDGPSILTRLKTQYRQESHQRKVGQPATSRQKFLVSLYRLHALAQGKMGVVRQIDTFMENEAVLADKARWSMIIEGLTSSGVVLPEQAQDEAIDRAVAEIATDAEGDTSSDVFGS